MLVIGDISMFVEFRSWLEIIILKKMIKYCSDSRKYALDKTYEEFISDERSLVFSIFSLSQVGELAAQLSTDTTSEQREIPWSALKSIRNRVVHDYEGVKYRIIWNIIQNEIEPLMIKLQDIISDADIV